MTAAPPLQILVDSSDELEERLCTRGLKVVEVYSTWCGPCRSVVPTLKKVRLDRDDEAALAILTVADEKCHLDAAREHQGQSEPLFLLYRNGTLKARIQGANLPQLAASIPEHIPANPEMDNLEDNPLYIARVKAGKASGPTALDAAAKGTAAKAKK